MNKWAFTNATQNRIGMWMIRVEDDKQNLICEVRAKTKEECVKNAALITADQSLKRELVEALKEHHVCFSPHAIDCNYCALIRRAEELK